jgi:hypothetical protein
MDQGKKTRVESRRRSGATETVFISLVRSERADPVLGSNRRKRAYSLTAMKESRQ